MALIDFLHTLSCNECPLLPPHRLIYGIQAPTGMLHGLISARRLLADIATFALSFICLIMPDNSYADDDISPSCFAISAAFIIHMLRRHFCRGAPTHLFFSSEIWFTSRAIMAFDMPKLAYNIELLQLDLQLADTLPGKKFHFKHA